MHLSVKGRDCTKRDTKTQYGLPRLMIRINDGTQVRGPLSSSPKLGPHLYDTAGSVAARFHVPLANCVHGFEKAVLPKWLDYIDEEDSAFQRE